MIQANGGVCRCACNRRAAAAISVLLPKAPSTQSMSGPRTVPVTEDALHALVESTGSRQAIGNEWTRNASAVESARTEFSGGAESKLRLELQHSKWYKKWGQVTTDPL